MIVRREQRRAGSRGRGEFFWKFDADFGVVRADDRRLEIVCRDGGCVRDGGECFGEAFAFARQGGIAVEAVFLADEKRPDGERRDY